MPNILTAYASLPRSRQGLIAFAFLFVLGVVIIYITTLPKPTPEEQIREVLLRTQAAAKQGDISGATDILSEEFQAGGLTRKRVRLLLMEENRNHTGAGYDLQFIDPQILPTPDNAPDKRLVMMRISVSSADGGNPLWSSGGTPLTLLMQKETRRVYLFFPVPTWRITAAPGLPAGIGDL